MSRTLQAFIFDLDGTLIDSLRDLATAVNRMLAASGFPERPLNLFPLYIGDGMRKLVERALPPEAADQATIDRCVAGYLEQYALCWHDQTTVYPGMTETLDLLRKNHRRLAVLSNKPDAFTRLCCDHFFQAGTFEAAFGQRDGIPRKPDPTAAFEIAEKIGVPPSRCAYVGDSGVDMQLAKAAGMLGIGVLWGFRPADELMANGADHLISYPSELEQFLL